MADHDDHHSAVGDQVGQDSCYFELMFDIQIRGRFVQYEDLGVLYHPAGEHDLLMLSCREFVEVTHRQIFNA